MDQAANNINLNIECISHTLKKIVKNSRQKIFAPPGL